MMYEESVWMKVRGERGSVLYIGSVYMPTDTSVTKPPVSGD